MTQRMTLSEFGTVPVDGTALRSVFPDHKSLNDKISSLEHGKKLIRLKRGLYVASPEVTGVPVSLELLANHIYGPSYVSMESGLRYYGLIPEDVYEVRSMTLKHSRKFQNELARFEYLMCPADYFSVGIREETREGYSFWIASPEKALCDMISYSPGVRPRFKHSMRRFLEEDLRLDMEAFSKMDPAVFEECAKYGKKKQSLDSLRRLLRK